MVRSRALIQIPAACALALSLAGCGAENPKPAPAPTKSASASSSPSGEVAPTLPPEARGTDEAAAKAFVRHYFALLSYAARTGKVTQLKAAASSKCRSCSRVTSKIVQIYNAGGRLTGHGYELRGSPVRQGKSSGDEVTLRVDVMQFRQIEIASAGAQPKTYPPSKLPSLLTLVRSGTDSWVVQKWTRA